MRRTLLLAVTVLAGCGGGEDGSSSGGDGDGRTLTGCLELWEGPHTGSTRLKYVAARQTMYAKVEVDRDGRCRVSFASKDGKVYGRYVEKENITGAWTQDAERAPVATAKKVVASANVTVQSDGGLAPGAP